MPAQDPPSRPMLGIGMHSYGEHWKAAKDGHPKARFHDALSFLEYARDAGAAGIQVFIGARDATYTRQLRSVAERGGLYIESQTSVPRDEADVSRFEDEVRASSQSGANVMRTALDGRRYETFDTAAGFTEFVGASWRSLLLAEPVLKRHRVRLAVENHKDWRVGELLALVRRMSSEYVGICVDTGNSIALLEDPMTVVEAYAPFAVSTHLKDMALGPHETGFLLSEVPLGDGFLDLRSMVATLRHANPALRLNIEMITRNPLEVPCLTEKYWVTLGDMSARDLALALARVRVLASKKALPRISGLSVGERLRLEDDNVRQYLRSASRSLHL